MIICKRKGCGKLVDQTAYKPKTLCGSQKEKGSCAHQIMLERNRKKKKGIRKKTCLTCTSEFSTTKPNKVRCGYISDKHSCTYKHKLKRKEPKLKVIEKPKPKAIKPEVYITPRLAHLAYIKQHNNNIKHKGI